MKNLFLPLFLCFLISCGEGTDNNEKGSNSSKPSTQIKVSGQKEDINGINFNQIGAYKNGWTFGMSKARKSIEVIVSNQEVSFSGMTVNFPKEGQYYITITFFGDMMEGQDVEPNDLKTGEYSGGSSFSDNQAVSFNVSTKKSDGYGMEMITTSSEATGKATLHKISDKMVSGSVDLESDGVTIKGDFTAPIAMDAWEKGQELKRKMKEMQSK